MRKTGIIAIIFIILSVMFLSAELSISQINEDSVNVYVIPIDGEINPATVSFIRDGIEIAEQADADLIVLEINTLGGYVNSAIEIKDIIYNSRIKVVSYINRRAISAGVLIAVSAEEMYMAPGSTIGAAETIPDTEKVLSFWKEEVVSVAQDRGKDPEVIRAMIDKRIEIPDLIEEGQLLTLSSTDADRIGFSDGIFNSYEEIIEHEGFELYIVEVLKPDFKISVARFVTSSYVAPVLLSVGFILLLVEIFTAGFGVAGTLSIMAFATFFGGHMLAGHAGWGSVILFVAGILLLLIEATMPGFGVAGGGGLVCVFLSVFFASSNPNQAILSISLAFLITVILLPVLFKYASRSTLFNRLILSDSEKKELGFVGPTDASQYLGKEGIVVSTLRPAGSALIDGKKIDVVSEGEFINKDSAIKVVKVEGARIVVSKL